MTPARLSILCVSPIPPSPPRSGAQARMHGLWTHLADRHDVSAVCLVDPEQDALECERALRAYCRDVVLVPDPVGRDGPSKRALQLRSLASLRSFEHHRFEIPGLQEALDRALRGRRYDVVNLEFPYLARFHLRQSPAGTPRPLLVVDAHDIAYEIVRQMANGDVSLPRRLYAGLNWRKLRREEHAAFRGADGVCTCSAADRSRLQADVPTARTVVIPNAVDVEYFQPRPADPPADGRTVLFFGLLSTFPNTDGVLHFVRDIWPRIAAARPGARCKIVGARPPSALQAHAGPRVEITGLVDDLRPHLASAAVIVVPLRIGSGTRLKILEGMAMARPIVSTTLGAEGIDVAPGRELLLADEPEAFAEAVIRLLDDPALADRLGREARRLAVERYSWAGAAAALERFYGELLAARPAGAIDGRGG